MSMGYGAHATLVAADDELLIYSYGCFNWNLPDPAQRERNEDGEICIYRKAFVEPEIHTRIKRRFSGRKETVVKRVPVSVDCDSLLEQGMITIHNASNTWESNEKGVDAMAVDLIYRIFREYQVSGHAPKQLLWLS